RGTVRAEHGAYIPLDHRRFLQWMSRWGCAQHKSGSASFGISRRAQTCSLSHFAMKLFFAAPASGLPSDPIALGSHASPLHLAMKLFFAAPASGSSTCTKYRAIQEVRL